MKFKNKKSKNSKHQPERLNVIFNSLDQLSAMFPLCHKEELFIPSIVELLNGEGVTSIFIAEKDDQANKQYGLLPMADLIVRFKSDNNAFDNEKVKVKIENFSGGKRIGNCGIVDNIINNEPTKEYPEEKGIVFKELTNIKDCVPC
jgi:hypothetical protein